MKAPEHTPATRRGASTRSITLSLSLVVTLAIAVAIAYVATRPPERVDSPDEAAIEAEDIMQILGNKEDSGDGMVIQRVDKDDPTRLVAEIAVARLDPDGPLHRNAEAPRAWLFADDGSAWYIEADKGRFYIPAGEDTPESGLLRGNVRVRRYAPTPGGARPVPDVTPPTLTATTDQPLHFDLDVLMFETDGTLHVHTDRIDFVGRGVYAVLNEKREKITYLRVDQGERLTYTPDTDTDTTTGITRADPAGMFWNRPAAPVIAPAAWQPAPSTTAPTPPPAAPTRPAAKAPPPAAPGAPKIDFYSVVFKNTVQAARGSQVIRADTLTVWTRLIDNKIPSNTQPAGPTATGPLPALLTLSTLATVPPIAPGSNPPSTDAPDGTANRPEDSPRSEPVVLTWTGPMEVHPLDDAPEPLTMGDDIALRFDVSEGHVEFEDTEKNARGRAQSAAYFAGRERIELLGPAGSIRLESPNAGAISGVNSMYIELAAGVVTVPTAGELTSRPDRPEADRKHINWGSSAMFRFAIDDAGRMTDRIQRARFEGGVTATDRAASLRGDHLDAMFDEHDSPRLIQLDVDGARGEDGKGGAITGDHMRVHFTPRSADSSDLDPRRVILDGAASASRLNAETIHAGHIDAALARDDTGRIVVTEAEANRDVVFRNGRGAEGRGEHLWADVDAGHAIIMGDHSRVSADGAGITGEHIELDNAERSVLVVGPGTFTHEPGADAARAQREINASWTDRMLFNDRQGRLECEGAVSAESISTNGTRDLLEAHRLELTFDPYTDGGPSIGDRLTQALVIGSPEHSASVESRRGYVETLPQKPRVDEVFRLEGGRIVYSPRDDRLEVPGPGKLFILDRRPQDQAEPSAAAITDNGGRRGTTLFTWTGSLDFRRGMGRAVFADTVRVAHKPLDQAVITELFADDLVARFAVAGDGPSTAHFDGDLLWAEARGNALLHIERRREINADRLLYNARDGLVEAVAAPRQRVIVTDLLRGVTSRPRAIRWDLADDRIEIIDPGSFVSPE